VIALAALATFSVHRPTLHYGFNYDDYHFIRPYTRAEVLASFHGPWDLREVMVPFYRPLTIAFHALRFELFGLNSTAHHAMSLALFALAAVLVAWLVFRFTARSAAAAIATAIFVAHPAMPYSLVAWVTNQMHLLQILVVLGTLLWWDAVRSRGLAAWLPLLLFGATSFLIKEDGVMLLPAIVMLHAIRRRVSERDLRPVPWAFAALALLLVALLVTVRFQALEGLGGYGRPTADVAWRRVWGALYGVFRLVPADRAWQGLASSFATILPLIAVVAWRWISPAARYCLASGAVVAVVFALPFVFAAKAEQVYLIGLGASLALTGASAGLLDLAGRIRWSDAASLMVGGVVAVGLASFVAVTRDISRDFEPFGPIVLSHDDIVRTWWSVPPELRDYVTRKRGPGAAGRMSPNPLDEVSHASFGFLGPELSPAGVPYLWMNGPRVEIQVAAHARLVVIPVRHQIEALREPTRARIEADGRPVEDLLFDNSEWHMVHAALRPGDATRIGRMHRIRITIDHAWVPAKVIPGSTDGRVLGLQIGTLQIR
jgi:hypothetical protein